MDRKAKILRSVAGAIALLNIIIFFLPLVSNSGGDSGQVSHYSQLDYVLKLFTDDAPYGTGNLFSAIRLVWVILAILIPLILGVVAALWAFFGSNMQKGSSVLIFITTAFYIIFPLTVGEYFPNDYYSVFLGGFLNIIITAVAAVISIFALNTRQTLEEVTISGEIPGVDDIKEQMVKEQLDIYAAAGETSLLRDEKPFPMDEITPTEPTFDKSFVMGGTPKGVMVGLRGMYAGAEIPLRPGEAIKLGRLSENDLVFGGVNEVSRHHCIIRFDGERFFIKDTSSNGTFANGSDECLPQNIEVELPVGTVIALGNDNNTFRVE